MVSRPRGDRRRPDLRLRQRALPAVLAVDRRRRRRLNESIEVRLDRLETIMTSMCREYLEFNHTIRSQLGDQRQILSDLRQLITVFLETRKP